MNKLFSFFESQKSDRYLGTLSLLLIAAAIIFSNSQREDELVPYFKTLTSDNFTFGLVSEDVYSVFESDSTKDVKGYISIGSADGFGGELRLAVFQDSIGTVENSIIIEEKETAAFLKRVEREGLIKDLNGLTHYEVGENRQEIDIVSGATYTSKAIVLGIQRAKRAFAGEILKLELQPEPTPDVVLDMPLIVLLVLFVFAFMATTKRLSKYKILRWVVMVGGLIFIGFIYSQPFSISLINKFVSGFFPPWQTNLYWYLLSGIVVALSLFTNKNLYCNYVCPFGAAQECIALISGTKRQKPKFLKRTFVWIQRILALALILIAVLSGNPSSYSYEVFSVSFQLLGTTFQFALLGVVLIASLIIKRPWCSYLCPLRAVTDYLQMIRGWVKEVLIKK